MKLIVGLGNPGIQYKETRHNVGFMFIEKIVDEYKGELKAVGKLKSQICLLKIDGVDVCLCRPLTYMNLSGEALRAVVNFYKIDINDILIIHDDLDLPVGKIRIRERGSHGGHNGMRNIIEHLGTQDIKRIRIGIDKKDNVVDFVLGKFKKEEREIIDKDIMMAPEMIRDYLNGPFNNLMNKYNSKNE